MNTATNTSQPRSRLTQGYLICLAGTVFWSTTGIFIAYLSRRYAMPPLVLAVWRDLFVTLGLAAGLAILLPAGLRLPKAQFGFLVLYGFIVSLFNAIWTYSVTLNGAAVATVLAYSAPAYTAVLGWRLFQEKLGWLKIAVVTASIFGCALVAGAFDPAVWSLNSLGLLTGILSGLLFSIYSLMGKYADRRGLNSWSTLMYAFGFATLFLLVYNLLSGAAGDLLWLGTAWTGWAVLALLGVGPTIGGYGLYTLSLSYLPMSVASLIATLEPAMTALLAYALLGEKLGAAQLLGSALILVSVMVLRLRAE